MSRAGVEVHGIAAPGFEAVRDAFARAFAEHGELGAACAAWRGDEPLVDLWGGTRAGSLGDGPPWEPNTRALVFSATKGVVSLACVLAASRGLLDPAEPVGPEGEVWPELDLCGRGRISVRELLDHRAGLLDPPEPLVPAVLADPDRTAQILARTEPLWEPGRHHGYHALTHGSFAAELVRRSDPARRTMGRFLTEELLAPLREEGAFTLGLGGLGSGAPGSFPGGYGGRVRGGGSTEGEGSTARDRSAEEGRSGEREPRSDGPGRRGSVGGAMAELVPFAKLHALLSPWHYPAGFVLRVAAPGSLTRRAFANPRLAGPGDLARPEWLAVELPSGNGVGTARAMARLYAAFAAPGGPLGLDAGTFERLVAAPEPPPGGALDLVVRAPTSYAFGLLRPTGAFAFGTSARAFGMAGAGGAFAFADPDTGIGYAFVTRKMGVHLFDDPREKPVRDAVLAAAARG